MYFEMFWTWSPSFVKIWDGLIPKLICLSCRPNSEFHVLNWSFDKKNYQIWCMKAQAKFCVSNHQEKCFDPKLSHCHELLMISEMQSIVGLLLSWKVWWREVLSLMKCSLSCSEKCWSEWKVKFLKHESVFSSKFWFEN